MPGHYKIQAVESEQARQDLSAVAAASSFEAWRASSGGRIAKPRADGKTPYEWFSARKVPLKLNVSFPDNATTAVDCTTAAALGSDVRVLHYIGGGSNTDEVVGQIEAVQIQVIDGVTFPTATSTVKAAFTNMHLKHVSQKTGRATYYPLAGAILEMFGTADVRQASAANATTVALRPQPRMVLEEVLEVDFQRDTLEIVPGTAANFGAAISIQLRLWGDFAERDSVKGKCGCLS